MPPTATVDAQATGTLPAAGLITETICLEELPGRFAHLGQHVDSGNVVVEP